MHYTEFPGSLREKNGHLIELKSPLNTEEVTNERCVEMEWSLMVLDISRVVTTSFAIARGYCMITITVYRDDVIAVGGIIAT